MIALTLSGSAFLVISGKLLTPTDREIGRFFLGTGIAACCWNLWMLKGGAA